jgi:uncharacterized protein (DUF4415 family)
VAYNIAKAKRSKRMKKSTPKEPSSKRSKADQTDYERLAAMKDEDIDFSDNPEATQEMFARGVLRRNFKVVRQKKKFPILLDSDVFWWYVKQGRECDDQINAVLRAYMEEHQTSF